jgi:hypothetical protein
VKITKSILLNLVAGAAVVLGPVVSLAAAESSTEEIEKKVLGLEETARQKFLKGESNWDDLLADGAYIAAWDGSVTVHQKGQPVPAVPMKSMVLSELKARVFGDVVVVTGLGAGAGETPDKKPFSFRSRFLNVWKNVDGEWKIVVTQNTLVKPPSGVTGQ